MKPFFMLVTESGHHVFIPFTKVLRILQREDERELYLEDGYRCPVDEESFLRWLEWLTQKENSPIQILKNGELKRL